jgi:hypothetical protein
MSKDFKYERGPIQDDGWPIDYSDAYKTGIYTADTAQRFVYGTRYLMWDGAVYKYSLSKAACYTGQLNKYLNVIGTVGIDYVVLPAAAAIGDTKVKMTAAVAQAEDTLAGGWIEFKTVNTDAAGNDKIAAAGTGYLYLNAPLTAALTTASYAFCMPNPYSGVGIDSGTGTSACGVSAVYVSATGYTHWQQTWGLAFCTDTAATLGKTANQRQLVLVNDGGVSPHAYATAGVTAQQHIGFIVDNNNSVNGMSLIMLQIDR